MAETRHAPYITGEFNFQALAPRNISPGDGVISGTAEDTGGVRPHAEVRLLSRTGAWVASVRADSDGEFTFYDIANGTYEVVVLGEGEFRSKVFGPIVVT